MAGNQSELDMEKLNTNLTQTEKQCLVTTMKIDNMQKKLAASIEYETKLRAKCDRNLSVIQSTNDKISTLKSLLQTKFCIWSLQRSALDELQKNIFKEREAFVNQVNDYIVNSRQRNANETEKATDLLFKEKLLAKKEIAVLEGEIKAIKSYILQSDECMAHSKSQLNIIRAQKEKYVKQSLN